MIVIGTDTHKRTHTAGAVESTTGEALAELTAPAKKPGFAEFLAWGRGLGEERVWAIEDCRHVSGPFERFLISHGERVVRVPPKLMAGPGAARASAASRTRSTPWRSPARRCGRGSRPCQERTSTSGRSRSSSWPTTARTWSATAPTTSAGCAGTSTISGRSWRSPTGRSIGSSGSIGSRARLRRGEQTVRVRIARELVTQIRQRTKRINELERELEGLVRGAAPQLLELRGCATLTAAKLVAEIAGADRFPSDAKLARLAGVAPIPASSGRTDRHRLDPGGNRQLNCALHRLAVNQGRLEPKARAYLARKEADGKSRMEALRCLKRQLVRIVWGELRSRASEERFSPSLIANSDLSPAMALT